MLERNTVLGNLYHSITLKARYVIFSLTLYILICAKVSAKLMHEGVTFLLPRFGNLPLYRKLLAKRKFVCKI